MFPRKQAKRSRRDVSLENMGFAHILHNIKNTKKEFLHAKKDS